MLKNAPDVIRFELAWPTGCWSRKREIQFCVVCQLLAQWYDSKYKKFWKLASPTGCWSRKREIEFWVVCQLLAQWYDSKYKKFWKLASPRGCWSRKREIEFWVVCQLLAQWYDSKYQNFEEFKNILPIIVSEEVWPNIFLYKHWAHLL